MDKNNGVCYPYDEMTTFLLPVTLGCSYNKCAFCSMYKDETYTEVPIFDIENQLLNAYKYTEKIFLTGAEPLSIGFDKMKKLLDMIHNYVPYCAMVASYASIKNIAKYSIEELSILHNSGLRLLYIGFETGRDDILKLMKKGHTVKEAIKQGKRLNEANIQFNSIIMYGIAGKGESKKNAIATANMINQFTTNKVITMNLMIFAGTELNEMLTRGEFIPTSGVERLVEMKTLLEHLQPKETMIFDTTHPTNIIRIKGTLPQDKEKLMSVIASKVKYPLE